MSVVTYSIDPQKSAIRLQPGSTGRLNRARSVIYFALQHYFATLRPE
jgi:hypothetical protein